VGEWAGEQSTGQMGVGMGQREWLDMLVRKCRWELSYQWVHEWL